MCSRVHSVPHGLSSPVSGALVRAPPPPRGLPGTRPLTRAASEGGGRVRRVEGAGARGVIHLSAPALPNRQVFAPFLSSVGASDIRAFEEGQLKDMQEHHKARIKMQQHRSKLEVSGAGRGRSRDPGATRPVRWGLYSRPYRWRWTG